MAKLNDYDRDSKEQPASLYIIFTTGPLKMTADPSITRPRICGPYRVYVQEQLKKLEYRARKYSSMVENGRTLQNQIQDCDP